MESTGKGNMIQISQATADILSSNGKHHWFIQREDAVEAKGKGKLTTFWLSPSIPKNGSSLGSNSEQGQHSDTSSLTSATIPVSGQDTVKMNRLVDWMTQLLLDYIKNIVSCS
jgi:Adenylate and Guanylate cyclase catalytic domain